MNDVLWKFAWASKVMFPPFPEVNLVLETPIVLLSDVFRLVSQMDNGQTVKWPYSPPQFLHRQAEVAVLAGGNTQVFLVEQAVAVDNMSRHHHPPPFDIFQFFVFWWCLAVEIFVNPSENWRFWTYNSHFWRPEGCHVRLEPAGTNDQVVIGNDVIFRTASHGHAVVRYDVATVGRIFNYLDPMRVLEIVQWIFRGVVVPDEYTHRPRACFEQSLDEVSAKILLVKGAYPYADLAVVVSQETVSSRQVYNLAEC